MNLPVVLRGSPRSRTTPYTKSHGWQLWLGPQVLSRPKPPQVKPKLGLLGQAGPEHHYFCWCSIVNFLQIALVLKEGSPCFFFSSSAQYASVAAASNACLAQLNSTVFCSSDLAQWSIIKVQECSLWYIDTGFTCSSTDLSNMAAIKLQ